MAQDTLESLVGEENPESLEELTGEVVDSTPVAHGPSIRNRAGYAALMSEQADAVPVYRQIAAEMEDSGRSRTAEQIEDQAKAKSYGEVKAAFMDFLVDENYSDEQKREAALKVLDKTDEMFNSRNLYSTESLTADSSAETAENEIARINLAKEVGKINEYKRQAQYLLTSEIAKTDTSSTMGLYMDVLETFIPFVEQSRFNNVRNAIAESDMGSEVSARDEADNVFSLLGKSKAEIRDLVKDAEPEKQLEMVEKLIEIVNQSDRIILSDENAFSRVEFLKTVIEDGYYTDTDEFLDNAVSVLDAVGVGALLKSGAQSLGTRLARTGRNFQGFNLDDFTRAWKRRYSAKDAQPVSPAENVQDTNPEKLRVMHEAAEKDESGEAASTLYGTSREQAVAGDILPEVATPDGRVRNRVQHPEKLSDLAATPDPKIIDSAAKDGYIYYTEAEKARLRSRVYTDFENAIGATLRHEMSQIEGAVDGGFSIKAVYGGTEGGYTSAQRAHETVKFALRHYGLSDDEIQILRRGDDGEYYPVDGIPAEEGDYLAQVNYNYKFNPLDVDDWSKLDVKKNLFDRMGLWTGRSSGSFQRHMVDAHSMLHPNITLGANVSVDKAAGLESLLLDSSKAFADSYLKLPKNRQAVLEQYIKEANQRGIPLKETRLLAEGFDPAEINVLKKWRQYWDTMYWLENKDLAKTLRSRGYEILEDATTDTRLFARRIPETRKPQSTRAYDVDTGQVRTLTKKEIEELYESNGTLATLRSPMEVGEDMIETVVVKEAVEGARLRGIRDFDKVLNYRQGYYTVNYTAPKFVVKRVKTADGTEYTRAVAVAGDTKTAEQYAEGLRRSDGEEYFVRGDVKKMRMDSDDYWNLQQTAGRVAQRVRGQRLEDASGPATVGADHSFVMGPVDSMVHAARSTSARIHMRNYLETTKQRFLDQFSNVLRQEKGMVQWPGSIEEIKELAKKRGVDNKTLGDAFTTYEYIRYLENGYRNVIDDGIRTGLRGISDILGSLGASKGERLFAKAADSRGVMSLGKNFAFHAYLSTNPLRQFVVQGHQATLLAVNFPDYVLKQNLARDIGGLSTALAATRNFGKAELEGVIKSASKISGRSSSDLKTMLREFQESGLLASVDKQNLSAGALTELAEESTKFRKSVPGKAVGSAFTGLRKVGFDAGETLNIMSSWLAHRDQMVKKVGRFKLTQEELDTVTAKARNYTYNMNFAGDMPYNQNALNLLFQFMQVPHKAMLQMTNRSLSKREKIGLFLYQVPMFTLPPAAMYSLFGEILPENQEARDAVVMGLEGYAFNKLLSLMGPEESRVDFASLAPLDMFGTYEFIEGLIASDVGKMLSESPSGQLFFGNNPRITEAFKSAARFTNLIDDYESQTEFIDVVQRFSEISSGFSNAFKARYAFKTGQKVNSFDVVDPSVTGPEAVAQLFGFPTMDETQTWYLRNKLYETSRDFEKDVRDWYRQLKIHLAKQEPDMVERKRIRQVFSEAWRVFGDNEERAKEIVISSLRRDIRSNDGELFNNIMRNIGWMSQDELRSYMMAIPNVTPEERQRFMEALDHMDQQEILKDK